jgi:hypothetical protein
VLGDLVFEFRGSYLKKKQKKKIVFLFLLSNLNFGFNERISGHAHLFKICGRERERETL